MQLNFPRSGLYRLISPHAATLSINSQDGNEKGGQLDRRTFGIPDSRQGFAGERAWTYTDSKNAHLTARYCCKKGETIMGIWELVKSELIDVIEWLDDSGDILVWRFPDQDHEIKMGAKLTVREGQAAVFVNEGQIADVFKPGLYTLNTQNLPVLTTLRSWKYGFESPFKAEVYFVNTRNFLDLKWGTQNPIMMRDKDFGVVRLRAFGTYGIRVVEPKAFMKEVMGTDGCFTTDEIEGQLRSMLVSELTGMLGKADIAALDLAANYKTMGEKAREGMEKGFQQYGLSLSLFVIENISLPPELEKMLDTKAQMGIVGDMGRFTQFQTAVRDHTSRERGRRSG